MVPSTDVHHSSDATATAAATPIGGQRTPPLQADTVSTSTSSSISTSPRDAHPHQYRHSIAIPSNSDQSWRAVGSPPRKLSISAAILPSSPLYSAGGVVAGVVGAASSASMAAASSTLQDEDYNGYNRPAAFRARALSTPNPFFQIGEMPSPSSSSAAHPPTGFNSAKWGGISPQWSGVATAGGGGGDSPTSVWQQHHETQLMVDNSSSSDHFRRSGALSAGGGFSRQHRSLSFTLYSAEEDSYFKNRIEYEPLKDDSGDITPVGFDNDILDCSSSKPLGTRSRSKSSSAIFAFSSNGGAVSPLPPSPASLGENIWSMNNRGPSPIDHHRAHLDIPFSQHQVQQRRGSAQPRLGELWSANNYKSPLDMDAGSSSPSLAYEGAPPPPHHHQQPMHHQSSPPSSSSVTGPAGYRVQQQQQARRATISPNGNNARPQPFVSTTARQYNGGNYKESLGIPDDFDTRRRHTLSSPTRPPAAIAAAAERKLNEAMNTLSVTDIAAPITTTNTPTPPQPSKEQIDDYFKNTEHRTRAWVEAGKNLAMASLSEQWPVLVVEFKAGRRDFFYAVDPGATSGAVACGDLVIVEADRGKDLGKVVEDGIWNMQSLNEYRDQHAHRFGNSGGGGNDENPSTTSSSTKEIQPKKLFRHATPAEIALLVTKSSDEIAATANCQSKIRQRKLPMEVVDAEYQWDRKKLTFYYVSDRRIDFRDLVRELFKQYKARIWMCAVSSSS